MAIPSYWLGNVVRITAAIATSTGATVGADPGGLTWSLTEPDGATYAYVRGTNAQLVSTSAGGFYVDWPSAKEGMHYGGWAGTGSNAGSDEFVFHVKPRLYD